VGAAESASPSPKPRPPALSEGTTFAAAPPFEACCRAAEIEAERDVDRRCNDACKFDVEGTGVTVLLLG
jgi:hypothetical protein